ncbi:MAG: ABC transporter ATP-binding protein [Deltaproteobacteria bacterium]|nr:ABC transporter ATP-binding protein [Deltaproteobacteria bacterium]
MSDILIKAEGVSKKFCKSLKRLMFYGVQDIARSMVGMSEKTGELKPGEFWANDDISFELKRGECLGLIGPNGSGKSTLLKILNGIISPDKGRIEIRGRVGALIEIGAGFHPMLTGRENIYVNGSILGFSKKEIDKKYDEILEFAELAEFIDTPVKLYSSGMRVRLGFAVAAQMEPDVLLIDEVLAVGDLGFKMKCLNAINEIMRNSAVIFVSHAMPFISRICTEVMVLKNGVVSYHDNNIGEGIDHYQSNFDNAEQQVSGSGKATVSNIRLSSGGHTHLNSKGIPVLNYGDDLTIEMDLTLDSTVEQPAIRVILWNQALLPVADCSSQFSDFEISPKKFSKIKLTIGKLYLNMGVYSIIIAVTDLSSQEICLRFDNAAHFQVKTTCTSWAHFLLRGDWSQE